MTHTFAPPPEHPRLDASDPGLLSAVSSGQARLTPEQGLELLRGATLLSLGRWADARCRALHGRTIRTYIIDRNINYTNVCTARCTFCAFRRDGDEADAYTLEHEQIHEKIAELVEIGGTQILMQGGMNPDLPLDWYLDLLSSIKARFPQVHVHAFSPPELIEFVNFFDPPGSTLEEKIRWVMVRLQSAGLDSVPGGGGEIFADPVRRRIGLGKCDAQAWLTTMYVAHTLGMFTSATMMFGHIEGYADRVHHMKLVRDWQDRILKEAGATERRSDEATKRRRGDRATEGMGHYVSFIAWPFQRENTPLGRVKDWGAQVEDAGAFPGDVVATLAGDGDTRVHADFGRRVRMSGSTDYLRTQALSRLFLDNIYSIGASWVTMGPHIGQVALKFGANDMGSVMMEENVVSSAGTTYCLDEPVLCRLIRESGFVPAQRDNVYDLLRVHDGEESPDLRVSDWSKHRTKRLHIERAAEPIEAALTVSAK
ncbi:MAG: radical SAM protein [Planctomycetes bacterium]|nr:radical SAM protein [Planctomycetota bacterium]